MIDYGLVKRQLLIALRGSMSQLEASHKAGFSFNQWSKWETEQKWLRWDEFIDLLLKFDISVSEIFRSVFSVDRDPREFQSVLDMTGPQLSVMNIAETLDQPEDTVRRWVKGRVSPAVETVFQLIHIQTNNFPAFVAKIVPIEQISALVGLVRQNEKHKSIEARFPFAAAIEACLRLAEYRQLPVHSDEWVADRTMVSPSLVRQVLVALEAAGAIRQQDGKFTLVDGWVQMNGLSPEEVVKVDRYWTQRALDRYAGPHGMPFIPVDRINTNYRSFRVAAVSTEAARAIQSRLRQVSQEILEIIIKDEGAPSEIKVYVSHCFDVKDIHWSITE